jgi:photosystem II stability/assembly factor-like uncharacterized protein
MRVCRWLLLILCIFTCFLFIPIEKTTQNLSLRPEGSPRLRGPSEASRWRMRVMRDEYGRIAPDGRLNALDDLQTNLNQQNVQAARALIWTAQGPVDRSGRIRAMVIHPKDPNILWAAAGSGGIWKSEDAGETWKPLTDHLGLPAGSLIMDPQNPDILYFGTGERFHSGGPGAGIYVTRDGGTSWKLLSGTKGWRYIPSIAICPTDSKLLLVAVADLDFPVRSGVYRSTNGGNTWSRVLHGNFFTPSSIQFKPLSGTRVLLAMREGLFPSGESRIMVSNDAGLTWQRSSGIGTTQFTRYEIAFAPSNPNVVYALSNQGVFRSTDAGEFFEQRSPRLDIGVVSWAAMIWVSPTDPNFLLAGGVDLARSRDGGTTWQELDYYDIHDRDVGHLDHQQAIADPRFGKSGNRSVYVLNDGGIDRFDDVSSRTFGRKRTTSLDHGMQTTEYYAVTGRSSDGLLLGGTQDRGMIRGKLTSKASDWAMGGDGACAILDPTATEFQYGCGQLLWIVRMEPNGPIGLTNDLIDSIPPDGQIRANFIAPVMLDPNEPKRMFAGGMSLWRSENVRKATHDPGERATWSEMKQPLPRGDGFDDRGFISSFAIAKGNSNQIWVGHNDGRIFHSRNALHATPAWETIDDNREMNPLPNRWPTRILIDRSNRNRVFIAFGGFTRDNLWVTTNGGKTWRSASGSTPSALPAAPIWSVVQHPKTAKTIVAGTEVGVYVSNDLGNKWTALRAPFTAAAQDLAFLHGSSILLVGTFGRGLWTINL